MSSFFITGIPTAGKSHLARQLSAELNYSLLDIDLLREKMKQDPTLKPWVDFYFNLNEQQYYQATSCDQQWQNLVNQSEAFWPTVQREILSCIDKGDYIFEGVNLLPHLMAKLDLKGVVLLGKSYEQTLARNQLSPRWGLTEELQVAEADSFFYCEREWYRREAERFHFQWFDDSEKAGQYLREWI